MYSIVIQYVTVIGKISRKERRGRRNQRLRKILQPKNPLMVLNELVGGHKFTVLEKDKLPTDKYYLEPDMFLASVLIDGVEHVGYGMYMCVINNVQCIYVRIYVI